MTTEWVDTLLDPTAYWTGIDSFGGTLDMTGGTIEVVGSGTEVTGFDSLVAHDDENFTSLLAGREILGYRLDMDFVWTSTSGAGFRIYDLRANEEDTDNNIFKTPGTGTEQFEVMLPEPFIIGEFSPFGLQRPDGFSLAYVRYSDNNSTTASVTITKLDLLLTSLGASRFWSPSPRFITRENDL